MHKDLILMLLNWCVVTFKEGQAKQTEQFHLQ